MPIFDDIARRSDVWPETARWPRQRADAVLARFALTFPEIRYDLYWETRLVNAQAFVDGTGRRIRLYGGLARHRRVGVEGIAFALAHETGHHLGGPPLHEFYRSLSSEERADQWALETGLALAFGQRVGSRFATRGLAQLGTLKRYHL